MTALFDWGPVMQAARRGEMPLVQFASSPAAVARHVVQPVYLATPYSKLVVDPDTGAFSEDHSRMMMAMAAIEVSRLKEVGVSAFSPIVLSAAVVHALGPSGWQSGGHAPLDAAGWLRWCQPFLNVCGAVVVPDLPGWAASDGIKAEVGFAIARGLPLFVYATGADHED